MAKVSSIVREARAMAEEGRRVSVTPYDRAASWMLALLISIGVAVALLLMIWLSNRIHRTQVSVPVEMAEYRPDGEGGGDGRPAGGSQLEVPSEEPFVGTAEKSADVEQDLSSLGTAVAANVVELDDPNFTAPKRQGAYGSGGGIYGGFGPGRGLGHGPGKPGFPRNWELIFQKGGTLETYAQQLDFFKIELGVIMPDNRIVYAYNLRKAKPDKKELKPAVNEKRFYLILQNGGLAQADEDLLARAGIQTDGRPVLKFLASETEQTLARLEREYKGASPKDIRRTRFGIKGSPGAYEFFVIDQPLKR